MRSNILSVSAALLRFARWRRRLKLLLLLLPAGLCAQTFLGEWSTPDIGRLGPTGLAVDTEGGTTVVYVADEVYGRIIKFDAATGARLAVYGETGTGELQFNRPFGIAIDPATHDLFVAERGNNRVQRITNQGAFVTKWGVLGTGAGEFDAPVGIAVDAAGHVYVSDYHNHRIQKFLVQGAQVQHLATWGAEGSANGQFRGPYGIALDAAGSVWVADAMNHRLQKFDANGNFLAATGSFGTGNGQFVTPTWITFDTTGAYYVCDTNSDPQNLTAADIQNQRIQKFSSSGTFLLKWGALGENGGQFRMPLALALDRQGDAFVSDYYNTRVQKFSLDGSGGPPTGNPPGTTADARFVNLSSRLRTVDGDASRAFIAGFVVGGSTAKPMLIRAVGPGLQTFGVAGTLANPKLRLYRGDQLIAENDDWSGNVEVSTIGAQVGAFSLSPASSKDAALFRSNLAPATAGYTMQITGAGSGTQTGIVLAEIYDATSSGSYTAATPRLTNVSARTQVGTGGDILIAGFTIAGSTAKTVLIRAVGPTLASFGVAGTLSDPKLELYSVGTATTKIDENDDWGGSPALAGRFLSVGAFPLQAGSRDAVLLVTLPPGGYTAQVAASPNTPAGISQTGVALVEVYEVP